MRTLAALASLICWTLPAAEHRGEVRSAGLPIPGAAVTASREGQSLTVYSDEAGTYEFPDLAPGEWRIEARMPGFDPASRTLTVADAAPPLVLEMRLARRTAPPAPAPAAARSRREPPAGFQQLAVSEAAQSAIQAALANPSAEPPPPELAENANESFLLSGSVSRGLEEMRREDPFTMNREEFQERLEALRGGAPPPGMPGLGPGGGPPPPGAGPPMRQGGGPPMGGPGMRGGFGGGPGGGGPGGGGPGRFGGRRPLPGSVFGNRTGRARDAIRGGASFSLRNSALDARPYSISGQFLPKPSYAQARFSLMAGGTLNIPKLVRDDRTFFFVNYGGARSRNPFDSLATLPSLVERTGDFSQSSVRGGPVLIADNLSRLPFANNAVPGSRIDPAARRLLDLFPPPNLPGAVQNYQLIASVPSNSDNFGLRLGRSFSRQDRLSGSFNIQQREALNQQLYGFRDTSSSRGQSYDLTWTHTIRQGFLSNLRGSFSRNRNDLTPYFAFGRDWAGDLGIAGTSREPVNYGPPNLSFTNYGALTDANASLRRDQSAAVSESVLYVRKGHNVSFGGEYRRTQANAISQQNARGAFMFSGAATSLYDARGFAVAGTGYDFADFLLGLPQSSTIRFGNADTYFRGSALSLFAQDDWRVRGNLTINAGLRYEFVRPQREKYGRMANLDIAPGFAGVAVVTPGVGGPYTGVFPDSLVEADPNNVAPRIGIAWRPFPRFHLRIRAGYGWYYNASVMNQAAGRLAQQPPFARTGALTTSLANPLTIRGGFALLPGDKVTNTYAVDRYYRAGYAQTWNLAVEQDLPHSLVLEAVYLGAKGTRLDTQRWPNRTAPGAAPTGGATGFMFDSSEANSILHSGQVRLSRRFRRGISANISYLYGKSIDNASTIGGGGAVVAQNDRDLAAERGLSSFDRRHTLNAFYILTTSTGRRGGTRAASGFTNALVKDWSLTGGITARSGGPFTATVLGNRSDIGGAGTIGSGRADATGAPVRGAGGFFSPAAFAVPQAGRFGNAGRNTIPGPGFFSLNASFGRTLHLSERRSADLRLEANNALNSVNISRIGTTVNAVNYGLALDAAAMRSVTLSLRMRF